MVSSEKKVVENGIKAGYISSKEASKLLVKSRLYRLVKQGKIRRQQISGKEYIYCKEDIFNILRINEKWIKKVFSIIELTGQDFKNHLTDDLITELLDELNITSINDFEYIKKLSRTDGIRPLINEIYEYIKIKFRDIRINDLLDFEENKSIKNKK